jgi:putative Mg2+ transporter-C (MgtC) family protein
VALVLGAAIGLERRRRGHPAGFRTMAMVCAGSCLFTLLGEAVTGTNTDPTRIAAQVVTGIGFLGAGLILRQGRAVMGVTTAAAIWVVAAIGMATGFGAYLLAAGATVLVFITLTILRIVEIRVLALKSEERDND